LIVSAIRALRREGDPRRALSLAEEAQRKYPRGIQTEEAMALSIEAAAACGESDTAQRWAKRYLERFPAGRFRELARRTVAAGH
jgi:Tfp pilus assembly protein PilF